MLPDHKPNYNDCTMKNCIRCKENYVLDCSYHCPCHNCSHTDCTSNSSRFNTYLNGDIYLSDYYRPLGGDKK